MSPNSQLAWLLLATATLLQCFTFTRASTEYNRYLAHLFQKYGNGGTMSFEGLEHLMYSLGLGHIEFDPEHTIDEHRPAGFAGQNADQHHDAALRTYFEQQTKHLQYNEDNVAEQVQQQQQQEKSQKSEAKDNDIIVEFKEMHDPKHRHPRENDATFDNPPLSSANVCLSPKKLLHLVVDHNDLHKSKLFQSFMPANSADNHNSDEEYNQFINNVRLTPVTFMKLCPALLAQIDQHVCIRPAPLILADEDSQAQLLKAWLYASCSIFVLSACGLLGVMLVPLMKSMAYQEILKFLVAIAVGTLSGDALMHLLPHALIKEHAEPATQHSSGEHHGHDNQAVLLCGCAFAVALLMYIIENVMPMLKGDGGHGHGHSHNHSHSSPKALEVASAPSAAAADPKDVREINVMLNETQKDLKKPTPPLSPVAFMVVLGDGLHNLTDGLAIGAAFATDPVTGLATAFAVLCHELPHELGDFALLLQTGVNMRRAICLNLVSSVLSFIGMAIGLYVAGIHESMTQWIYAGTAGSFLYIAFADLLPAMSTEGEQRTFKDLCIQIVGIALGGLIMLTIAVNEDDLEKIFQ